MTPDACQSHDDNTSRINDQKAEIRQLRILLGEARDWGEKQRRAHLVALGYTGPALARKTADHPAPWEEGP